MTTEEAAQHFVARERDRDRHDQLVELIFDLWSGPTCTIHMCQVCGFGFSSPFVAGNSPFYNTAYPGASYSALKWEFTRTLEALRDDDTANKAALEIGAGSGFFLDMISERFFDKGRLVAIEFNETARVQLRRKGYNVIANDVRSPEALEAIGKIDYGFMFQVLEHMDDLEDLFSALRVLTRPGGRIFIAVPNPNRINYQERTDSLLDMPPNHISRWTAEAFKVITARHGFKIIAFEIEPFSISDFITQDLIYSHKRRAQKPGTISNRVQRISSNMARRTAEAAAAVLFVPTRIPVWYRAMRMKQMGGSLWVQLQREDPRARETCY